MFSLRSKKNINNFLLMEVLYLELNVGIYHSKMRRVFRGFCSGHFIILLILMVIK